MKALDNVMFEIFKIKWLLQWNKNIYTIFVPTKQLVTMKEPKMGWAAISDLIVRLKSGLRQCTLLTKTLKMSYYLTYAYIEDFKDFLCRTFPKCAS